MYKKNKKALLILIMGIIASLFIALSPDTKNDEGILIVTQTDSSVPFFNFSNTETNSINSINRPMYPTDKAGGNLTDTLIQFYKDEITKGDQVGGSLNELENLVFSNPEAQFNIPYFQESDLSISDDNSPENQHIYLQALSTIILNNFKHFDGDIIATIDDWMARDDAVLVRYVDVIPRQMDNLLALEVPSFWKTLHLQNLNLWHKKFIIYGALLNMEQDLVRAALAFQEIPRLMEETTDLQIVVWEKARTLENTQ